MSTVRVRRLAVLATLAVAVGACAAPASPPPAAALSPPASPTLVPVATPRATPSPTAQPGAGLGCGSPVGSADEFVLVEPGEGPGLAVSAIAPDGSRRLLAEIAGAGTPARAEVSPCGHLALQSGDQVTVFDLANPERRVRMTDAATVDGEWDLGRDGRVTLIDSSWGNVIVFDPRDGTTTRRPWPAHVSIFPSSAWDGSGWYADTGSTEPYGPPERVGIVDEADAFRQSAVLAFDAHGFLWRTGADGSIAGVRPDVGADDHQALDLYPPGGRRVTWRHAPAGRQIDGAYWDARGTGLWVVEVDGPRVHVLHVTGPGEAAEVPVELDVSRWWYPTLFDAAGEAMVMRGSGDDGGPVPLSRLDLATGSLQTLVENMGDALVAGWAAPRPLAPGVVPPTPFGTPELPVAAHGPVAPDLPLDALAIVSCSAAGTVVTRSTVRALEDGVHFLVRHPDGSAATVEAEQGERIEGYAVVSLPPGTHEIDCGERPSPSPARIDVLDPVGLYRPWELECTDGSGVVSSMDGEPVAGPEAAAWLRTQLQLAPGDVLEPAGYPAEAGPRIVLVRSGRVVASFGVLRAGDDLGIASTEHCAGVDVER